MPHGLCVPLEAQDHLLHIPCSRMPRACCTRHCVFCGRPPKACWKGRITSCSRPTRACWKGRYTSCSRLPSAFGPGLYVYQSTSTCHLGQLLYAIYSLPSQSMPRACCPGRYISCSRLPRCVSWQQLYCTLICAKVECSFCLRVFIILSLTHVIHHPLDIILSRDDIFYNELQLKHYETEYVPYSPLPPYQSSITFPPITILLAYGGHGPTA